LIRIPVGPEPAAVPPETAAVSGAIVLAETGPATTPAMARLARMIRSARIAFGIDGLGTGTYSRAVPRP
jgi:hypothetical protein